MEDYSLGYIAQPALDGIAGGGAFSRVHRAQVILAIIAAEEFLAGLSGSDGRDIAEGNALIAIRGLPLTAWGVGEEVISAIDTGIDLTASCAGLGEDLELLFQSIAALRRRGATETVIAGGGIEEASRA